MYNFLNIITSFDVFSQSCAVYTASFLVYNNFAMSCFMPCDLAPGLSLPYPSSKLITPQIPSPAPSAITRVWSTLIAEVKKVIS